MITKQEIMDFSHQTRLAPHIVEKDYVLGWILAGINNQKTLSKSWIFKGGTCLKKCYFEDYRFSEDLDFTLVNETPTDKNFLISRFREISEWLYDQTNLEIPHSSLRFETYQNKAGKTSIEGRVGYIGPLKRQGDLARIKLDLTANEILVTAAESREVHHPYTDKPTDGIKVNAYNFSEIFAEKIRALSERARPRDLYDVIHLYRHRNINTNPQLIFYILRKKCEFKSLAIPSLAQLEAHTKRKEMEIEWENMLSYQVPELPKIENFWNELPNLFFWLYETQDKVTLTEFV